MPPSNRTGNNKAILQTACRRADITYWIKWNAGTDTYSL